MSSEREKLIQQEIDRLEKFFTNADESKREVLRGAIVENARIKIELDEIHGAMKLTGPILVNKNNPSIQRETVASKIIARVRASYDNSFRLLCKELIGEAEETEEDLEQYA